MSKRNKKTLPELTWADLEAWAGARIVSRGTSYQKSGYVRDLAVTYEGGLLAWVRGSENYATTVSLEKESTFLRLHLPLRRDLQACCRGCARIP